MENEISYIVPKIGPTDEARDGLRGFLEDLMPGIGLRVEEASSDSTSARVVLEKKLGWRGQFRQALQEYGCVSPPWSKNTQERPERPPAPS